MHMSTGRRSAVLLENRKRRICPDVTPPRRLAGGIRHVLSRGKNLGPGARARCMHRGEPICEWLAFGIVIGRR